MAETFLREDALKAEKDWHINLFRRLFKSPKNVPMTECGRFRDPKTVIGFFVEKIGLWSYKVKSYVLFEKRTKNFLSASRQDFAQIVPTSWNWWFFSDVEKSNLLLNTWPLSNQNGYAQTKKILENQTRKRLIFVVLKIQYWPLYLYIRAELEFQNRQFVCELSKIYAKSAQTNRLKAFCFFFSKKKNLIKLTF